MLSASSLDFDSVDAAPLSCPAPLTRFWAMLPSAATPGAAAAEAGAALTAAAIAGGSTAAQHQGCSQVKVSHAKQLVGTNQAVASTLCAWHVCADAVQLDRVSHTAGLQALDCQTQQACRPAAQDPRAVGGETYRLRV